MGNVPELSVERIPTPIGEFLAVFGPDGRLQASQWADRRARMERDLGRRHRAGYRLCERASGGAAALAIGRYFDGDPAAAAGLDIDPGGTSFQQAIWTALLSIPCGETATYAGLARAIGRPSAIRAVGHANAANPISLVIPCHRLVGSNGSLTGYGGGIDRKRWLLEHEARVGRPQGRVPGGG